MIALDDQALARLVISATRIPPRHRAKWLRAFAREVDPITLNARRCGRIREREGAAVAFYRLKRTNGAPAIRERLQAHREVVE
jgi:hypothetical protein